MRTKIGLLLLCLCSLSFGQSAPYAPTAQASTPDGRGGSYTQNGLSTPAQAGDLLVAMVVIANSSATPITTTGVSNSCWVQSPKAAWSAPNKTRVEWWYCPSAQAGTNVTTFTLSGSAVYAYTRLLDFSLPPGATVTLDAADANSASAAVGTFGLNLTTTGQDLILVGGAVPNYRSVPSPYVIPSGGIPNYEVAYGIGYQAGTYKPGFTGMSSREYETDTALAAMALKISNSVPAPANALPGSTGALFLTGCQGSVLEGNTCTFTPSKTANLTTTAGGTLSCTINCAAGVAVTYTAPPQVPQGQIIHGCQAEPADSIYSTRIDSLPVHQYSNNWIGVFAGSNIKGVSIDAEAGIDVVPPGAPTKQYTFNYASTYNSWLWPIPASPDNGRQNGTLDHGPGYSYGGYQAADHHFVWVQPTNPPSCNFFELYKEDQPPGRAQAGWQWTSPDYSLPSAATTTAGNTKFISLMITDHDFRFGLNHAVRYFAANLIRNVNNSYVWPATAAKGASCPVQTCPELGAILRLKASVLKSFQANTSVPPLALNILTGLAAYPIILNDIGNGAVGIEADAYICRDPQACQAMYWLERNLNVTNFEYVDQSSLMVSAFSSQVSPSNPYVVPAANIITATDSLNDPPATLTVAVQPITIATPEASATFIAGTFGTGYQFTGSVYGSANTAINWSCNACSGSVTPNGTYTPPAWVKTITTDVVTLTAQADNQAQEAIVITILPADPQRPNALAIDIAGPGCDTTSGCTRPWLSDWNIPQVAGINPGAECTSWNFCGSTDGNFPQVADRPMWQTGTGAAEDLTIPSIMLPNGQYRVTYYDAATNCTGTWPHLSGSPINTEYFFKGPVVLDANGAIGGFLDFGLLTNPAYNCRTPITYSIPAMVTNNKLLVAARGFAPALPGYPASVPVSTWQLNGLTIDPDPTTKPHWSFDGQLTTSLSPAQTLQFTQVNWYTLIPGTSTPAVCPNAFNSGTEPCTFAVNGVPGGNASVGTISNTGFYTAPATVAQSFNANITVTDGTYNAAYSIGVQGAATRVAVR